MNIFSTAKPISAMITIATQFFGSLNALTNVSMVEFSSAVTPLIALNFKSTTDTITITIASVPKPMTFLFSVSVKAIV